MGITPSTMCCHDHRGGAQQASDRGKKEESSKTRGVCPEASLFCPTSPLHPVKMQPVLSRVHFLVGCTTMEEHNRKIRQALAVSEKLHGARGLTAMGFEYRRFYCIEHQALDGKREEAALTEDDLSSRAEDEESTPTEETPAKDASAPDMLPINKRTATSDTEPSSGESSSALPPKLRKISEALPTTTETPNMDSDGASQVLSSQGAVDEEENETDQDVTYTIPLRGLGFSDKDDIRSTSSNIGTGDHLTVAESLWDEFSPLTVKYCLNCRRKLVHIDSGTTMDQETRPDYIADGIMYDRVAVLCQEAAHEAMMEDYDLEWTQVAPSSHHGERPEIRALVSMPPDPEKPTTGTIFIVTGRGAVKAGIFSRKALVCGEGLEVGSAWHLLREASLRRLHVIMPDPNCRGDRWGYDVMRQTFRTLWPENKEEDVYMVIHSAGGSNVQRFLLDTPDTADTHLPQIQAMALTDSTHNLNWCKKEPRWRDFWESDRCIYFKSAQTMRDADGSRWYLHAAGTPIQTDTFWQHRFGKIRTCNAGTDVHAMTNWFSHQPIWRHLDQYWKQRQQGKQPGLF